MTIDELTVKITVAAEEAEAAKENGWSEGRRGEQE